MRSHRQWNSRGYLPHCDEPGKIQSVTIRLYDSMPAHLRHEWEEMLKLEKSAGGDGREAGGTPAVPGEDAERRGEDAERRRRIEAWLDAGHGSCYLRKPAVAGMVEDALHFGDGVRYRLLAWVIMPNHLHFVFEMQDGWPLGEVMHGFKSFTSHQANGILNRSGKFWYPDYRDRYVRNLEHLRNVTRYIHQNPVKAGLVSRAIDWRWSSAREGARESSRIVDHEGVF